MDYISRENAIKALPKHCENILQANVSYQTADIYRIATDHAIDVIKGLPAADVVEVIRCKECKYFLDPWGCEFLGDGCRVNKNGYCFFAERRG